MEPSTTRNRQIRNPLPSQAHKPAKSTSTNVPSWRSTKTFKCTKYEKFYPGKLDEHVNSVHTPEIIYICQFANCGKTFLKKESRDLHATLHDPKSYKNQLLPCPICKMKFKQRYIRAHVARNLEKLKKFKCDVCNAIISSGVNNCNLKRHKLTHLSEADRPSVPCEFCEQKFRTKGCMNRHVEYKHSKISKKYICIFCDMKYKSRAALMVHLRVHTRETPFACSECDQAFARRNSLTLHFQKVHVGVKNFKCSYCNKEFFQNTALKQHLRVHEGYSQNYPCPTPACGKSYKAKSSLKTHMKIHTGENNYQCNECNKCFTVKKSLRSHSAVHSDTRPRYSCDKCLNTFSHKTGLNAHSFLHLNQTYTCKTCSKTFNCPSGLRSHVRIQHTDPKYTCELCSTKFSKSAALAIHIKRHVGEKQYVCPKCPMAFVRPCALDLHMSKPTVHNKSPGTSEKAFKCKYCSKAFLSMRENSSRISTRTGVWRNKAFNKFQM